MPRAVSYQPQESPTEIAGVGETRYRVE